MFGEIWSLTTFALAIVGGVFAFGLARGFVRRRLRFVDAVRSPFAPILAAVGSAIIVMPFAAILPLVTGLTAATVGAGVGFGTRSGVRALQRGE